MLALMTKRPVDSVIILFYYAFLTQWCNMIVLISISTFGVQRTYSKVLAKTFFVHKEMIGVANMKF